MISNSVLPVILVSLLSGFPSAGYLLAQEPAATPEVSPTPAPTSSRSKVSFVRLWYVGGAKSPRITASLKSGDHDPRVVGSHVRPGRLGSYRMFLPGTYSLIVMDGNVVPDATGKLPVAATPVTPPVLVTLKPGSFHTVVVEETNGRMASTVMDDVPPKPETGSELRVFDYTGSTAESVCMTCNEKEFEVWNSSQTTPFKKSLSGIEGPVRLELHSKINDKPVVLNAYETTIEPQKSYSLVMFFDRYGDKSFSFVEDATAPVGKVEMDTFLESR